MRTDLPEIIAEARKELGLSVPELALAARIHPVTLYRIIGGKFKRSPRPQTLRKLARALQIPLEDLTDQVEIASLTESYDPEHPLEGVLERQLDNVPEHLQLAATQAAVAAMVDVHMGNGRSPARTTWRRVMAIPPDEAPPLQRLKGEVVDQFRRLPRLLQRTGAREAARAIIDVQLRDGHSRDLKQIFRPGHSPEIQPVRPYRWRRSAWGRPCVFCGQPRRCSDFDQAVCVPRPEVDEADVQFWKAVIVEAGRTDRAPSEDALRSELGVVVEEQIEKWLQKGALLRREDALLMTPRGWAIANSLGLVQEALRHKVPSMPAPSPS